MEIIIKSAEEMQSRAKALRKEGKTIGFVPTMGALHEGHLSLVRRAKEENDITVVSIFVNPTQFGPQEDFNRYPRDLEGDSQKLASLGVDILFYPSVEDIYPEGYRTYVTVEELSDKLCGAFRPGHFRGVATVVTILFNIVMPHRAYFGLKDYQQSVIIRRMVRDLRMDIDIVACPTVREPDGLAMSSRNTYLNEKERKSATVLYRALKEAEKVLLSGGSFQSARERMQETIREEPLVRQLQYASIYDPETLDELSDKDYQKYRGREVLLAVALYLGPARLIDNLIVRLP
ncbi:MAG: pantoate--beta-alanine ligase [Nitrospirae bacterium]|nr:MAG: pantoate--beta-alanine ligase [Nitrospirota bacterium]